MKFELVDPAGWDAAEAPDNAVGQASEEAPGAADDDAAPTPAARLKASTARLKSQVSQDVARIGPSVAQLMERVSAEDPALAGSGHRSGNRPPSNFRADMFGLPGR
ncbi:hypothetical protein [Actinorugispora endophytica]|uniref:Uncharacterized protein n=1 Tax=Actinorugispora endophytica TaxID=1605990 RepID=A0A4R6UXS5_9ACTN|nr:hypothetical protein [Actinorugispora endophytica]TDQ52267.1 hypothetical protein EV190_10799 [Actinorugispora endophytica]